MVAKLPRAIAAAASAALTVAAISAFSLWRHEAARIAERVEAAGLPARQPDLATRIAREPDPIRAGLALGRALFAEATDRRSIARLPVAQALREIEREGEKLAAAQELAGAAWARRPASGEAAMVFGGAAYLAARRSGERNPPGLPEPWQGALSLARALAPAEREPVRLLAVAALERWPSLDGADRSKELAFLREAFADAGTLATLIGPWLRIAADAQTAFAAVPDVASAWETVSGACARRGDWDGTCEARRRQHVALRRELHESLQEARRRLAGGDPAGARAACWQVVRAAPPDLEFASLAAGALEISPAGPVDPRTARAARDWLDWALGGTVRGVERLPPGAVGRLLGAAGEVEPPVAALAALAAGDLQRAEVLERRSEALNLEEWAPYCLAKARALAARGETDGALAILSSVNRSWRGGTIHAQVRLAIVRAARGSAPEEEAILAGLAATRWPATSWRWRGGTASLDLLLAQDAESGLVVAIDQAPAAGAVVAVRLDGSVVTLRPATTGGVLTTGRPVRAGPHVLEVETVAGGRVSPGEVTSTRE